MSWIKVGNNIKGSFCDKQKLFDAILKQFREKKGIDILNIKDNEGIAITEEECIMKK